jgi:G:T-mismatch repair DNA endonuclease (very short patch repair protein)
MIFMLDNIDYVVCKICKLCFPRINAMHLKHAHGISIAEYVEAFPHAVLVCEASKKRVAESVVSGQSANKIKKQQMEEFGVPCAECGKKMNRISPTHLKQHQMSMAEYRVKYPHAKMESDHYKNKLSASLIGRVSPHKGRTAESHRYIADAAEKRSESPNLYLKTVQSDPEAKKALNNKAHQARNESYAAGNFKIWCDGLTTETDDRVKRISEKQIGRVKSDEERRKLSERWKGKTYEQMYGERAEEMREKRRDETVRRLASEEGFCKHDTLPERIFEAELVKRGLVYTKQVMVKNSRNKMFTIADFSIGDLYIYVDGDYWHGNPEKFVELNESQKGTKFNDSRVMAGLKAMGLKALRVWEKDVIENVAAVVDRLLK